MNAARERDVDQKVAVSILEHYQVTLRTRLGKGPVRKMDSERLQSVISLVAISLSPSSKEDQDEIIAKLTGIYEAGLVSKYQDPFMGVLLDHLSSCISQIIIRLGYTSFVLPLCGVAATGRVNGKSIYVKPGSSVVIIEDGLFSFANLLAKAIAQSYVLEKKSENPSNYGAQPETMEEWQKLFLAVKNDSLKLLSSGERLGELLFAYVAKGDPKAATPYVPVEDIIDFSAQLTQLIEIFVVSHECAHCVLGHGDEVSRLNLGIEEERQERWRLEFQADTLASVISQVHAIDSGLHPSVAIAAIAMFLSALNLLEQAIGLFIGEERAANVRDGHPSQLQRRDSIIDTYRASLPETDRVKSLALTDDLPRLTGMQWDIFKSIVEMTRDAGGIDRRWTES